MKKEDINGGPVEAKIGLGVPGSTVDDNQLQLDCVHGSKIIFRIGGTERGTLSSTGFSPTSDIRLKKDIISLDSSYCLQKILELNPVSCIGR